MTILIKVTESKEAPPTAGSGYKHYLAGNVYGPETDPPATLALVRRALAEGWAVAWPPEAAPVEVGDFADALALLGADPIAIARALTDPGDVQTCDDCGLVTDDPDVMFSHACVVEVDAVDLAPLIETLPPLDPLLAALGPLPEGVHVLTGIFDDIDDISDDQMLLPQDARVDLVEMEGSPDKSDRIPRPFLKAKAVYPPVEPIAVFDASGAIHAAPQAAPIEQAPDVPEPPVEAPKTAARKGSKTRKPATSRKR